MEIKSKTQRKKEAEALQKVGKRLMELPPEQFKGINLPEEIYNAVKHAKTIKARGGLRRQMQYIGVLMRRYDPAPILEALQNIEEGNYKKTSAFKEIEQWRDELVAGNESLIEVILKKCPDADRQQLAQLVHNALTEREHNHPPKVFRELFRYLKKIRTDAG
ncbi:MAG: DUF615 domain-containing protein [Nitrospirae bacterium]|nr:DUF615 domain-containing protein [Nitrospirota bacterium]